MRIFGLDDEMAIGAWKRSMEFLAAAEARNLGYRAWHGALVTAEDAVVELWRWHRVTYLEHYPELIESCRRALALVRAATLTKEHVDSMEDACLNGPPVNGNADRPSWLCRVMPLDKRVTQAWLRDVALLRTGDPGKLSRAKLQVLHDALQHLRRRTAGAALVAAKPRLKIAETWDLLFHSLLVARERPRWAPGFPESGYSHDKLAYRLGVKEADVKRNWRGFKRRNPWADRAAARAAARQREDGSRNQAHH